MTASEQRDPDIPPGGRELLLLFVIAVLTLVPVTLPVPVLRGLVQERFGVSDFLTGLFMSVNMVGALFTAPLAGAIADRLGRCRALIGAALLVDGLCFFGLTLDLPYTGFLLIRLVEGCAHIFALSLLLALAASRATDSSRARVMGAVGAGITLGVAMGAPIGGQLGGTGEAALRPLWLGGTISLVAAALAVLTLRDAGLRERRARLRDIVRMARAERSLLAPLAYAFVDRFTVGFFITVFPLYLPRVHDMPIARVGMLLGLFMLPFALLSYPAGRLAERVSRRRLVVGGSVLYGLGLTTLGLWPPAWLPVLMLYLGVTSAVMFVPSLVLLTDVARPAIRSTALGGFNAAGSLGFITGPLVAGGVSQLVGEAYSWHLGYGVAFVVAGVAELVCVLLTWGALRDLAERRLTT